MPPIAYLASRYPAISHTFIRREVAAMRARGVQIDTFSLRSATPPLSDEDLRERETTWAVVPQPPVRVVSEHTAAFLSRPGRYVGTLQTAMRHRMPGARQWLWSVFHFAEAVLLARELERRGITHLHSHFSNAGGDVGMLAAQFLGIGWSLTLHGSADFDAPTRSLLGEKIAASRFTACVSHFGRALAMRLSDPREWDKLSIVRCGVDLDSLPQRQSRPEHVRARVLSIGRLSPEKGFVGLVDAFAAALKQGLDAELRILGEGPERARIEARIAQHAITDRCQLPGAVTEAQVRQELRDADVFALSSFMEGLPVVLMESMAIGVPVVAPRVAGVPELVEHGRTGYLFTPGVWAELASCIHLALSGNGEHERMVKAARRRIEEEFDIRVAVNQLISKLAEHGLLPVAAPDERAARAG